MNDDVKRITTLVGRCFRTFGGGQGSDDNPLAAALKDNPLMFAAGVDVAQVVTFVIDARNVLEASRAPDPTKPDPIAAAVDAQLDPLKDELIAMGHRLAEETK
jgi:hypothetical protein